MSNTTNTATVSPAAVKATATVLAKRLSEQDIQAKRTACLDLVCAAYGLAHRNLLGTTALVRPEQPNRGYVERVAAKLAQHDDVRRAAIVETTLSVAYPSAVATIPFSFHPSTFYGAGTIEADLTPEMLDTPEDFFQSEPGRALVTAWATGAGYSRYYSHGNDASLSLKDGSELADRILDAIAAGEPPHATLAKFFRFGESPETYIAHNMDSDIERFVEEIAETAAENGIIIPAVDVPAWEETARECLAEALNEADDTGPEDLLDKHDQAEVVFFFGKPGWGFEDVCCSSLKPWSDPAEIQVNQNLEWALASLGYSLEAYRALSGNAHPGERLAGLAPRRAPVVTEDDLREMIENACTSYFAFVLYAVVPVTDLLDVRKGAPLTFQNARVGTYNPSSGTFYNARPIESITVGADEGTLRSCHGWYSPNDICDFVVSKMRGRITCPADKAETSDATGIVDAGTPGATNASE